MITTYHSLAFHNQMKSTPWTAEELFDFDLPESTDELAYDGQAGGDITLLQDRDQILNHLRHLTISSLSSYEEIASSAMDPHLRSFAEVIVRQRSAQQQSLSDITGYLAMTEEDEDGESLAALRSLWRGAIWNLQEGHHGLFLEYAERAEALLEESYLLAAQALVDDPFASEIRNYAVMICGARAVIEELMDSAPRRRTQHQFDNRNEPEVHQVSVIPPTHIKSRLLRRTTELDQKRAYVPTQREEHRRDWGRSPKTRSTSTKPTRSESHSAKMERPR